MKNSTVAFLFYFSFFNKGVWACKHCWSYEIQCLPPGSHSPYIAVVGTKPCISKMRTLQETEKTYFTFNVSQQNQTFFQVIWGHFSWSIHHEIYTQCKDLNTDKNGDTRFFFQTAVMFMLNVRKDSWKEKKKDIFQQKISFSL